MAELGVLCRHACGLAILVGHTREMGAFGVDKAERPQNVPDLATINVKLPFEIALLKKVHPLDDDSDQNHLQGESIH